MNNESMVEALKDAAFCLESNESIDTETLDKARKASSNGRTKAIRTLARIVILKNRARIERLNGNIATALSLEATADNAYLTLPKDMQW